MPDPPDRPVSYRLFVGVDIAAATATVAWQSPGLRVSRPITIDQTPQGFTALGPGLCQSPAGSAPRRRSARSG